MLSANFNAILMPVFNLHIADITKTMIDVYNVTSGVPAPSTSAQ